MGARFMVIGFGALLITFVLRDGVTTLLLWHGPLALAGGIVCAGMGKAIGLWHSHAKLTAEVSALVRQVQRPETEV